MQTGVVSDEMQIVVKELLDNLRAALDYCAHQAWRHSADSPETQEVCPLLGSPTVIPMSAMRAVADRPVATIFRSFTGLAHLVRSRRSFSHQATLKTNGACWSRFWPRTNTLQVLRARVMPL